MLGHKIQQHVDPQHLEWSIPVDQKEYDPQTWSVSVDGVLPLRWLTMLVDFFSHDILAIKLQNQNLHHSMHEAKEKLTDQELMECIQSGVRLGFCPDLQLHIQEFPTTSKEYAEFRESDFFETDDSDLLHLQQLIHGEKMHSEKPNRFLNDISYLAAGTSGLSFDQLVLMGELIKAHGGRVEYLNIRH